MKIRKNRIPYRNIPMPNNIQCNRILLEIGLGYYDTMRI